MFIINISVTDTQTKNKEIRTAIGRVTNEAYGQRQRLMIKIKRRKSCDYRMFFAWADPRFPYILRDISLVDILRPSTTRSIIRRIVKLFGLF